MRVPPATVCGSPDKGSHRQRCCVLRTASGTRSLRYRMLSPRMLLQACVCVRPPPASWAPMHGRQGPAFCVTRCSRAHASLRRTSLTRQRKHSAPLTPHAQTAAAAPLPACRQPVLLRLAASAGGGRHPDLGQCAAAARRRAGAGQQRFWHGIKVADRCQASLRAEARECCFLCLWFPRALLVYSFPSCLSIYL